MVRILGASVQFWEPVPEGVPRILDAIGAVPAFAWSRRLDLVAANHPGYALYAPLSRGRRLGR
ncbi:MmyB family transcriptional regulator [Actinacidiphila rubida]